MTTVLVVGTSIATIAYFCSGIFGYVTFSMNPDLDKIIAKSNILQADYAGAHIILVC